MSVAIDQSAAKLNPERLRYIARKLVALQSGGLNWFGFGVFFFLSSTSDLYAQRGQPLWWGLSLLQLAAVVAAVRYIPGYYERRFGKVELRSPSAKQFGFMLLVILAILIFGGTVGRTADSFIANVSRRLHGVISDPDHRVNLLPIWFWLWAVGMDITSLLRRDRRFDISQLRFSSLNTIVWAVVFLFPLQYPSITQLLFWKILSAGWLGISFMAIGLHEHVALLRLLPKKNLEEGDGDAE